MEFEFVREQAIRTFQGRTSYAFMTTGPAEFPKRGIFSKWVDVPMRNIV